MTLTSKVMWAVMVALVFAPTEAGPQTPPTLRRDAQPAPTGPAPPMQPPLPPLTPDAQRLLDQLKQEEAGLIEQLRALQLAYRESGHAEDAAAIAAHVRQFTRRDAPVTGSATAELVNEGLPPRDEPVRMTSFRGRTGETLSFAIRGRTDQTVWGTTTYTDDSGLEAAAVHAGMLRDGQVGIVKVRILPGQEKYDGTQQNGVSSVAYGRHDGSYRFTAVSVVHPTRTSSLSSFRDLVGFSITVPLIGSTSGTVWGSDVYTDDSTPAAAAVHAGVLQPGEFGFVKITLLAGQPRYEGSVRFGVTSQNYEAWEGSFRIEAAQPQATLQLPGGEDASALVQFETLRGRTGLSFQVQVVGTTSGSVWGSGIYTDDSSIAAAAVHAGLLKPAEIGILRVTIVAGQRNYAASESNGVKSQAFGGWDGSFRLERVK